MSDYEIGFGKPPKREQFKAGQSGNPRGRPRRRRRADVPSQLCKDVLEIANETIEVRTSKGTRTLPMQQVILTAIANGAAKGNPTCIKHWIPMYENAVQERHQKYAIARLVEMLLNIVDNPQFETDKETMNLLDAHIGALNRATSGGK